MFSSMACCKQSSCLHTTKSIGHGVARQS
uniref:Uncharacterized protein n=1 Tax=Arundo donax TaxID=35708 RepID=A0A0A9ANL6_ARUDO